MIPVRRPPGWTIVSLAIALDRPYHDYRQASEFSETPVTNF
jgi:predicted nucleotidyltransferase